MAKKAAAPAAEKKEVVDPINVLASELEQLKGLVADLWVSLKAEQAHVNGLIKLLEVQFGEPFTSKAEEILKSRKV